MRYKKELNITCEYLIQNNNKHIILKESIKLNDLIRHCYIYI